MKIIKLAIILTAISIASTFAQENCLNSKQLLKIDLEWEQAILKSDVKFLEKILAEDFIWVHNHAVTIDSRTSLLKRASDPNIGATGNPKSRISKDVKVMITGSTGIVTGFTVVDRGPNPTTYHFMRTYVEIEGNCQLVANHTMIVPDENKQD